jgi:hypothetical protein
MVVFAYFNKSQSQQTKQGDLATKLLVVIFVYASKNNEARIELILMQTFAKNNKFRRK